MFSSISAVFGTRLKKIASRKKKEFFFLIGLDWIYKRCRIWGNHSAAPGSQPDRNHQPNIEPLDPLSWTLLPRPSKPPSAAAFNQRRQTPPTPFSLSFPSQSLLGRYGCKSDLSAGEPPVPWLHNIGVRTGAENHSILG